MTGCARTPGKQPGVTSCSNDLPKPRNCNDLLGRKGQSCCGSGDEHAEVFWKTRGMPRDHADLQPAGGIKDWPSSSPAVKLLGVGTPVDYQHQQKHHSSSMCLKTSHTEHVRLDQMRSAELNFLMMQCEGCIEGKVAHTI